MTNKRKLIGRAHIPVGRGIGGLAIVAVVAFTGILLVASRARPSVDPAGHPPGLPTPGAHGAVGTTSAPPHDHGHVPGSSGHRPCDPSASTPQQRAAADALAEATRRWMTSKGYEDFERAVADGYVPISAGPLNVTGHYVKPAHLFDGHVLDPERIEVLWYSPGPSGGKRLWAAMYTVQEVYEEPAPQPGGCLTSWHTHVGQQAQLLSPPPVEWGARPGEDCWHDGDSLPMLHVFTPDRQRELGGATAFDMGSSPELPNGPALRGGRRTSCGHSGASHPAEDWGSAVVWSWPG
jgi:hypothetical protein